MPVSHSKIFSRLLICGLLPALNIQADDLPPENQPSMGFLEYLGGVESEIDGRLSSPLELDLEAAIIASNTGEKQTKNMKAGSEENIDE